MSPRLVAPLSGLVISFAFLACSPGFAASADSAPPDREMLRMMDLLQEMDMIKQIDMLQDMRNLGPGDPPAKISPGQKSAPTKQKEIAK